MMVKAKLSQFLAILWSQSAKLDLAFSIKSRCSASARMQARWSDIVGSTFGYTKAEVLQIRMIFALRGTKQVFLAWMAWMVGLAWHGSSANENRHNNQWVYTDITISLGDDTRHCAQIQQSALELAWAESRVASAKGLPWAWAWERARLQGNFGLRGNALATELERGFQNDTHNHWNSQKFITQLLDATTIDHTTVGYGGNQLPYKKKYYSTIGFDGNWLRDGPQVLDS
jgi:hypothetical protein